MRWQSRIMGALMLVGLAASGGAGAATIGVTETVDELNSDGDCSLREAVQSANQNTSIDGCTAGETGSDTIELPAGRYTLSVTGSETDDASANDLDVTESVEFIATGNGPVTIEPVDAGAFGDRAFTLGPSLNSGVDVVMRGFTIRGFRDGGSGSAVNAGRDLELVDMTFRDNAATAGGSGGAVSFNDPNGKLLMDRSGFVGNYSVSGEGGAINIRFNSSATIRDSTFVRNHAQENGGAIHIERDPAILRNVTLADNSANGSGGGLFVGTDGEVLLRNSILNANRAIGSGPDCGFASNGAITGSSSDGSTAFNLISDASGCGGLESFPDTIAGQSARLAMTGRYDGDTPFRPLLADSPAIDAGSCSTGGSNPVNIGTDQRRVSRIQVGSGCDIGAIERNWTPYVVDSTDDAVDANPGDDVCDDGSGACTLRAAIDEANATIGMGEVVVPDGKYSLALTSTGENANADGDLDVRDSLVIHGTGPRTTSIDADGIDRVLEVPSNGITAPPTLALSDLEVTGGDTGAPGGTPLNDQRGGGVLVNGPDGSTLLLERVRVSGNRASDGAGSGFGGGVFVDAGNLHAHASVFDDNEAQTAYSAVSLGAGSVGRLQQVTATGNRSVDNSAAIGAMGDSRLLIEHSTVVDNTAIQSAQLSTNAIIEVYASIIAGSPGDNCGPFSSGSIVDLGRNIEDGADCGFASGVQSANVDLAPLADVGGPLPLREPNAGSDAVDAAGTDACAASTGRLLAHAPFGGTQPQDADATGGTTGDGTYACDVGAAERQQVRLARGPAEPADRTVGAGSTDVVMAQVTVTNESGEALDGASARLTVRALGSGVDDADVTGVRLYFDADDDGELDPGDEQRGGSRTFASDNGRITFDFGNSPGGAPGDLLSGDSANYLVVYDFATTLADAGQVRLDRAALAGLAGGSGVLVLLAGFPGLAGLRRRPVPWALPLAVLVLTLAACGGGSGGGDETGGSSGGDSGSGGATYSVALEGGTVTGASSARTIDFRTPAVEGATVTVEE